MLLFSSSTYVLRKYFILLKWEKIKKPFILGIGILLMVLTFQSSLRASFKNADYPFEYLVYAHAAPGPKETLYLVEEISERLNELDKKIESLINEIAKIKNR